MREKHLNAKTETKKQKLIAFLAKVYKFFLTSRYRVELKNIEIVKSDSPLLLFPNHQALVDPQILFSEILQYTIASPLIDEKFMAHPLAEKFFKSSLGAIKVPDLEYEITEINLTEILSDITEKLHKNQSVVIYPEGRITSDGYAFLGGRKLAYLSAKEAPQNTRIIAVRIRGLWGSMWSRAWIGKSPNFITSYLKAIFIVFANFLFFVPKRKVAIEFEDLSEKLKEAKNLTDFNKILEDFYNSKPEELKAVRHFFYLKCLKKKLYPNARGSRKDLLKSAKYDKNEIDEDTFKKITALIKSTREDLKEVEISLDDNLLLDLYFDSLDLAEVYTKIKKEFKTANEVPLDRIKSVSDLCLIALGKFSSRQELPESKLKEKENEFKNLFSSYLKVSDANNILKASLKILRKHIDAPLFYDASLGNMTRRKFLLTTFVLAEYLKSFKGKYIGIMLPASISAELVILATYLARKTPVMINWTQGEKAQEKALKIIGDPPIISAEALYKKVEERLSENLKKKLIFLENLKTEIKAKHKIFGAILYILPRFLLTLGTKDDDLAVILFSSGTESEPKSIPLTHKNIMSNLRGAFSIFKVDKGNIFFSALPPFHSFGFTVTGILPLVSGVRFAYSPDPSDSFAVARLIEKSEASIIGTAPSFLAKLIKTNPEKLKTLKQVIVGAEKCPLELFDEADKLGIKIYEGYGLTECSPVVSVNPSDSPKQGSVGVPLNEINIQIANPENPREKSHKKEGLILARGASVFDGYLEKELNENAFVEFEDGKKYFVSGDLGYLDEDGYLYISGRLKHFVKISGEMISLPEVEEALRKCFGKDLGHIAVLAKEDAGKARFVVISEGELGAADAQKCLQNLGISPLVKIHRTIKIKEMPLLGSGKINYRELEKHAEDYFKEI